jgi:sugar phosphate isomerase/epimerase
VPSGRCALFSFSTESRGISFPSLPSGAFLCAAMRELANRRTFLKKCLVAGAAATGLRGLSPFSAQAVEPFKRAGGPRLRLSLAAYSFREYFNHKDPAKRLALLDFIDYCADQGLDGTELTSYYFPENFQTDYLLQVKRRAFLRGIAISGSAVGNNFALPKGPERDEQIARVKRWVDHCAVFGAPHIRVFAGPPGNLAFAEAKRLSIEALAECAEYAGRKGIFLGVENHGGIVAEPDDLLEIIRAVQSPWLGINLDTGNFNTADPYADLARCAPYAVNVQVKVEIKPRGAQKQPADLVRAIKLLRDANYQGWVALEYEAAEDPWKAVPGYLKKLRELMG